MNNNVSLKSLRYPTHTRNEINPSPNFNVSLMHKTLDPNELQNTKSSNILHSVNNDG